MKSRPGRRRSFVRSHADILDLPKAPPCAAFHVRARGSVAQDGPSAGVTMTTALASLLRATGALDGEA